MHTFFGLKEICCESKKKFSGCRNLKNYIMNAGVQNVYDLQSFLF